MVTVTSYGPAAASPSAMAPLMRPEFGSMATPEGRPVAAKVGVAPA